MIDFDPIALIERGYLAHRSELEWLESVTQLVREPLDVEGNGVAAYFLTPEGPRDVLAVEPEGGAMTAGDILAVFEDAKTGLLDALPAVWRATRTPGFTTLAEITGAAPRLVAPFPIADSPGVIVNSGEGSCVIIASHVSTPVDVGPSTRQVWQRVALHLGAGLRLVGRSRELDADDVEVVLDASGAVAHATGAGAAPEARATVSEAVARLDRLRTREGRSDRLAALELWQALLDGRWSLVEQFDSDGRRFVTARRNDPSVASPTALSRRQRQVVFYASLGWSFKEIGYALGLAESTVNTHLGKGLERLGLRSRAELIRTSAGMAMASLAADS